MFHLGNVAVAYIYLDYRKQEYQTPDRVTASLLKQLAMAMFKLPDPMLHLYEESKREQRRPSQQHLEEALLRTCELFSRVVIVFDALDEADEHRKHILQFLQNLQVKSKVNIFLTSRYLEEISRMFPKSPRITISSDDHDIKTFVASEVESSDNYDIIDETFKCEIISQVSRKAQSMYVDFLCNPRRGPLIVTCLVRSLFIHI